MSGGERQEIRFEGAGVSPGMACGKIHVVRDDLDDVPRYRIAPSQVPDEIGRFETALIQTRMQILEMQQRKAPKTFLALSESHILVAHNLTPSDTASMNRANVLGIATDLGSRTSHAAILARSLNIPAVVGLHDITAKLETGQHVLVDGSD